MATGIVPHSQYYVSETLPEGSCNVHHVFAPVEKVECCFPPDVLGQINSFASSLVFLHDGTYRFYGTSYDPKFISMGVSVWESSDGLHWAPRNLGQVRINGKDTNLLRFDGIPGSQDFVGQPQVVLSPNGGWRMYFWKHKDGHVRYLIAESEDGFNWRVPDFSRPALYHPCDKEAKRPADCTAGGCRVSDEEAMSRKRLLSNDATYVYYNEESALYECYSAWLHPAIPDRRVDVDNAPNVHRLIHRRFSEDGIEWSDPELVIMPDDRDPWDLQFYYLAVQRKHHNFMIGSLGHYRVEDGQQTVDMELCFSRDGMRWDRPVRGGFIKRGKEPGAPDSMGIYAPNTWLECQDGWLCLYTGTSHPHNAHLKGIDMHVQICGARFPKERFVGLAASGATGGFLTEPFFLSRKDITVDADIRGWLRSELCDAFGRKLPGFHLMDSIPVQGDSPNHILRWKEEVVNRHLYECLRIRFEFEEGEIYSVSF